MSTGPKKVQGRGGARPNSGKKPDPRSAHHDNVGKTVPEGVRNELMAEAKVIAKERGLTVHRRLLDLCFDDDQKISLAALKLYYDTVSIRKIDKKVVVDEKKVPTIVLPALKDDPSTQVKLTANN